MSIWHSFKGFDGRISRKYFWLGNVILSIVYCVIVLLWLSKTRSGEGYFATPPADFNLAVLISSLVVLYPWLAVWIKRLHDLNLTGWWCAPVFIPSLADPAASLLGLSGLVEQILLVVDVAVMAVFIVSIAVLGFRPGTIGPNRYGDDPRA
jgi:uncharacterized membrane protein YhaH (DUF805 family)